MNKNCFYDTTYESFCSYSFLIYSTNRSKQFDFFWWLNVCIFVRTHYRKRCQISFNFVKNTKIYKCRLRWEKKFLVIHVLNKLLSNATSVEKWQEFLMKRLIKHSYAKCLEIFLKNVDAAFPMRHKCIVVHKDTKC